MTELGRCGPDWLHDKIVAGDLVVIDGGMGTELEARRVPMNDKAWSGAALWTHPEVVQVVHAEYIAAGAEVIITNTFGSGQEALNRAGLGDEMEVINARGVEVALRAREEVAEGPVAIAGSMCPAFISEQDPTPEQLSAGFRHQAEVLANAGVDLIALEMCYHPVYAPLIVEAAIATGLPVWLGLSCQRDAETGDIVGFETPNKATGTPRVDIAQLVCDLAGSGIGVINIMHSAIADTAPGLSVVKDHWSGPIGAYPESGHFVMPNWQFVDIISPEELVHETKGWVAAGAQIIGGCCGLGVPHIEALNAAFV